MSLSWTCPCNGDLVGGDLEVQNFAADIPGVRVKGKSLPGPKSQSNVVWWDKPGIFWGPAGRVKCGQQCRRREQCTKEFMRDRDLESDGRWSWAKCGKGRRCRYCQKAYDIQSRRDTRGQMVVNLLYLGCGVG